MPQPVSQTRNAYLLKKRFLASTEAESQRGAIWNDRTQAVASAITCGHSILPKGFARVIDSAKPAETVVTFLVGEKESVVFEAFAGETIDTKTMMARLADPEWMAANGSHPLAFAYWAIRNYAALVKSIKAHKPLIMFQRGRNKAYVVVGGDRERNRFVLERAKFSPAQIEEILSQVSE